MAFILPEFEGGWADVAEGVATLGVGVEFSGMGSKVRGAGVDGIEGEDVNMVTEELDEAAGGGKDGEIEPIGVVDVEVEEFSGLGEIGRAAEVVDKFVKLEGTDVECEAETLVKLPMSPDVAGKQEPECSRKH